MVEPPYQYVRFRWLSRVDLEEAAKDLEGAFSVKKITMPRDNMELSLFKDERDELEVKADTLKARISPFRAVLYQNESAPFTERDMELRKRILKLYPRNSQSPFPWAFSIEPKFETKS